MHPLMHVRARFHLETTQSVQHDIRHLGRGGIVQIVELRVREAGKFPLERGGIKHWL